VLTDRFKSLIQKAKWPTFVFDIIAQKMKVKIWSDVMCPFCYIGKRRFEQALKQFKYAEELEIEWKSFQLNPDIKTDPKVNINEYLAEIKGWSIEDAKSMNDHVTGMAAAVGLKYNFDTAIVANSFNAHRFSHLAKEHQLGDAAEEALFKAYFTEGRNIDDIETLGLLGAQIGLDASLVETTLATADFSDEVKKDIAEARYLGIQGVPFFVFNDKYGISGAQDVSVFLQTLEQSFGEWQEQNPKPLLTVIEGQSCSPDGDCS